MVGNGKKIFQKSNTSIPGMQSRWREHWKRKHLFLPFLVFSPCAWELCGTAWELCRTAWKLCGTALELCSTAWKSCGGCLKCYQRGLNVNGGWGSVQHMSRVVCTVYSKDKLVNGATTTKPLTFTSRYPYPFQQLGPFYPCGTLILAGNLTSEKYMEPPNICLFS